LVTTGNSMKRREELEKRIEKAEREIRVCKEELYRIDRGCPHSWSGPFEAHIHHNSYVIPGDDPGAMGVDRRESCYVPAKIDKRWKRVCTVCGKIECTSKMTEKIESVPIW